MENTNSKTDRIIMPESAKSDSSSDWSSGDLYSRAWTITKKYKVLWLFGMVAMTAGGSSNWSRSFNSGSNSSTSSPFASPSPAPLDNLQSPSMLNSLPDTSHVLGANTSGVENMLTGLFAHINPGIWALLGLEIFAFIILGWVITIIKNAWANSALLAAVEDASSDKNPDIESVSSRAISKIKPMAWVQIIPGLLLFLVALVAFGIPGLIIAFGNDALKVLGGILIIPVTIIFAFFAIRFALANIWATRLVVTENISGREAFSRGVKIQKKKKWAMLLLGLVNGILGAVIFIVPIAIIVIVALVVFGIVFGISMKGDEPNWSVLYIIAPFAGILGVAIVIGLSLASGIFNAFKAVVWSLAYRKIKGKYDA